jgi:L-arabinose isomerase
VADLVAAYRSTYDVAPDVTSTELEDAARAELALRSFVAEHQLAAVTYQFLAFGDDDRTVTLPFVAASRMMADGIGFGGEGDLIGAAGTALLHGLRPPATFSEMFTVDFVGNALFMSHMGEANVAMARRDRRVPLVARPTPITRTRARQLALVTSLEPGPATLAALTLGPAQRWRLLAAPVSIEDYGPLPDFCVPHFKLRLPTDVRRFLTGYAHAGGPHHNAVCFGDARRRLRFAARLLGAEYCEIETGHEGSPTAAAVPGP